MYIHNQFLVPCPASAALLNQPLLIDLLLSPLPSPLSALLSIHTLACLLLACLPACSSFHPCLLLACLPSQCDTLSNLYTLYSSSTFNQSFPCTLHAALRSPLCTRCTRSTFCTLCTLHLLYSLHATLHPPVCTLCTRCTSCTLCTTLSALYKQHTKDVVCVCTLLHPM